MGVCLTGLSVVFAHAGPAPAAKLAAVDDLQRLKRSFYILTGLRWLPVGAVIPFMVLFMLERGLELDQIGVAVAAYAITVAVLELPTGGLADTLGRRPVLLAAETISGAGLLLFLFAVFLPQFAVAWAVLGVGRALNSGALDAWFVDEAMRIEPEIELHQPLSVAAVVGGLGIAIGAIGAAFIPKVIDSGWALGSVVVSDVAIPIIVALVLGLVHLVAIWILVREERRESDGSRIREAIADVGPTIKQALRLTAEVPIIRSLMLVMIASGLALSSVEILWQPHFADLAGGAEGRTELFGIVAAIGFAAAAAGSGLSPRFVRLIKGRSAIAGFVAMLGVSAALLGLALSDALLVGGVGYLVFYVFVGLVGPLHAEMLHRQISSEERTTMLSADSLSLQLGGLVGTAGIAALAAATSIALGWVVVAGTVAASSLLYLVIDRHLTTQAEGS